MTEKSCLDATGKEHSVRKEPQETTLTHKQIMKILPADICQSCPIKPLICKKKWVSNTSFRCNAIDVITEIVVASR